MHDSFLGIGRSSRVFLAVYRLFGVCAVFSSPTLDPALWFLILFGQVQRAGGSHTVAVQVSGYRWMPEVSAVVVAVRPPKKRGRTL